MTSTRERAMKTREFVSRIEKWQVALAEKRIPDLLAYGLSLFSIALGVTMVMGPQAYSEVLAFHQAFSLAKPEVWGVGYIATGILLGAGFFRDRKSGQYAGVVMTAMFAAFGFFAGQQASTSAPGAVWSGPLMYTFVSYVSAVCVIACSTNPGRRT